MGTVPVGMESCVFRRFLGNNTMHRRKLLGLGLSAATLASAPASWAQLTSKADRVSPKPRIFITGSSTGLGHAAAKNLLAQGCSVVVHVRSRARLSAVEELLAQGAVATVGDLSDLEQTRDLAAQVNALGRMDAVIHNAGVYRSPLVFEVNTIAPYLLTALIHRPKRLIYLSSRDHYSGRARLERNTRYSYADSKLFVTTLALAVARLWPDVLSNAVNPGWVPTRMGGAWAPDDLRLGHLTQEWLATSDDPQALTSGGYWYHQQRQPPHEAALNHDFQNRLLDELARMTSTVLA